MSSTMPRQNLILLRIEWKGDDNEDGVGDDGDEFKSKWLYVSSIDSFYLCIFCDFSFSNHSISGIDVEMW